MAQDIKQGEKPDISHFQDKEHRGDNGNDGAIIYSQNRGIIADEHAETLNEEIKKGIFDLNLHVHCSKKYGNTFVPTLPCILTTSVCILVLLLSKRYNMQCEIKY